MESKFANLPDELQIELSLKVATLHQKFILPSGANVELCFRKLLQGRPIFFQQMQKQGSTHTLLIVIAIVLLIIFSTFLSPHSIQRGCPRGCQEEVEMSGC